MSEVQPWHAEILALRELVDARLNAITETSRVFKESIERVPTQLQVAESRIHDITQEKFQHQRDLFISEIKGVTENIESTQTLARTVQADASTAIAAAFAAADKAVNAQNTYFADIMDRTEKGFSARLASIESQIGSLRNEWIAGHADLKDRVVAMEAMGRGAGESRSILHSSIGNIGSIIGIVGVGAAMLFGILALLSRNPAPSSGLDLKTLSDALQQHIQVDRDREIRSTVPAR